LDGLEFFDSQSQVFKLFLELLDGVVDVVRLDVVCVFFALFVQCFEFLQSDLYLEFWSADTTIVLDLGSHEHRLALDVAFRLDVPSGSQRRPPVARLQELGQVRREQLCIVSEAGVLGM
jgi:hypothetical protein